MISSSRLRASSNPVRAAIATAGGADKLANLNLERIDPYVDFYNVMTYDFHGGWESQTGHQAAMTSDAGGYDVLTAIDQFRQADVDLSKVLRLTPAPGVVCKTAAPTATSRRGIPRRPPGHLKPAATT